MSVANDERAVLVRTLQMVGPDAPTLCPGWTTRQLARTCLLENVGPTRY